VVAGVGDEAAAGCGGVKAATVVLGALAAGPGKAPDGVARTAADGVGTFGREAKDAATPAA